MSISNLNLTAIDNLIDLEPQIQTLITSTQVQQVSTGPVMYCYGYVISDSTLANGGPIAHIDPTYPNTFFNNSMANLWAQLIPINVPVGVVPNTIGYIKVIPGVNPAPPGSVFWNGFGNQLEYKQTATDNGTKYLVNLIIQN